MKNDLDRFYYTYTNTYMICMLEKKKSPDGDKYIYISLTGIHTLFHTLQTLTRIHSSHCHVNSANKNHINYTIKQQEQK